MLRYIAVTLGNNASVTVESNSVTVDVEFASICKEVLCCLHAVLKCRWK